MSDTKDTPAAPYLPEGAVTFGRGPIVLGLGLGLAALAGWLGLADDPWPNRAVVGVAVAVLAGLAGWVFADAASNRPRKIPPFGESDEPVWSRAARAACAPHPADTPEPGAVKPEPAGDPYEQLARAWRERLNRRLWFRFAAAGSIAICGALAAFVRLTPERVLVTDPLELALPAIAGVVIAALGAVAVLALTSAWHGLFDKWTEWARNEARKSKPTPPAPDHNADAAKTPETPVAEVKKPAAGEPEAKPPETPASDVKKAADVEPKAKPPEPSPPKPPLHEDDRDAKPVWAPDVRYIDDGDTPPGR